MSAEIHEPFSQRAYRKYGGADVCPFCHATGADIVAARPEACTVILTAACGGCKKQWFSTFQLYSYEEIK
jgi:hypothetical protein